MLLYDGGVIGDLDRPSPYGAWGDRYDGQDAAAYVAGLEEARASYRLVLDEAWENPTRTCGCRCTRPCTGRCTGSPAPSTGSRPGSPPGPGLAPEPGHHLARSGAPTAPGELHHRQRHAGRGAGARHLGRGLRRRRRGASGAARRPRGVGAALPELPPLERDPRARGRAGRLVAQRPGSIRPDRAPRAGSHSSTRTQPPWLHVGDGVHAGPASPTPYAATRSAAPGAGRARHAPSSA